MPDIRLQDYVVKIRELIRSVRLDEAIAHCQHILRHYPKHIETYSLLGEACLEREMYREAIEFFQRTLGADPENLMARVGLGVIYDEQGAYPEAIWQLERAFELVPGNAEVRRELLRLYGQYDDIDKTRLKLTRGALGRLYSRNGLYERAIGEFRAVLRQDPDLPDIRVALLEALWREGRQLEAVEMCLELLDDLPNCLKANLILGDIWLRGGDEESASQRLSVARALDPENRVAQELMGKDSPLPPEEVLIPELDAMPDDFGFAPSDVPVAAAIVAAEEVETVALVELAEEEEEAWGTDEELPDWLRDVGVTAEEPALDLAEEAVLEPPPDELVPTEEMPEWLQEVMGEEGLPPAGEFLAAEGEPFDDEYAAEDLEARELADAAAATTGAGLAGAAALAGGLMVAGMLDEEEDEEAVESAAPGEEMPEWLQELVGEAEPPSDEELESEAEALAALAVAEAVVEAPDRLEDLDAAEAEETVALPALEAEEEPELEEEALPSDEIPDWLQDLEAAEVEEIEEIEETEAPPIAEVVVEEEPSVTEEEALEDDEIPDWLRDLGVTEVEEEVGEQPVADLETVEVSAPPIVEDEEEAVVEEVPLIDEIPDWLRDLDAVEVEEISSTSIALAGEEMVGEAQVPASLQALVAAGLLDEADLESAMAEMSEEEWAAQQAEDVPDWLKELVEEEEPAAAEAEAVEELIAAEVAAEVFEPEPEAVIEEAVVEVVEAEPEPEAEIVVEEAAVEIFEPEPEAEIVVEEAAAEVFEPEPEVVVEEAAAEVFEPEPEAVVEEAAEEVFEPEPEAMIEEVVVEAVEAEPEPEAEIVAEEAAAEVAEEIEAPSRADELLKQLKTRPRDYSARLELARLQYTEQDWDRALANYEKLISARRFLPDVVDDLESLADQGVEAARVYHMLGDAYMQQDQLDEALEMYRLARQKLAKR